MKRNLMFMLMCLSMSFLLMESIAFGESKTEGENYQVYTLGEVVISAEKGSTVKDVSINNVMTQEQIQATDSKTAAEALTYVPGVIVSTGRKQEPGVSIQGFPQDRLLILIDGVPYYETKYGKLDLNQIPADIIARIEVIKGAPSVIYGANAEGGVVNIITKKAGEKPSISARTELSNNKNGYLASVSHGMKAGRLSYWLNYTHRQWDAWRLSDDFEPVEGQIVKRGPGGGTFPAVLEDGGYFRDNSKYKNDSVWAKVGYEASSDSEYYANMHYSATEKGLPPSIYEQRVTPFFSQFAKIPRYDDWGIDLSGRQKIVEPLTVQGTFFYHRHVDDYASYPDQTYEDSFAVSRYRDYLMGGMLLSEYRPVEWDLMRMAFHYKGDSHEQRDDVDVPFEKSFSYTGSVGFENNFNLIQNLSVVAGASYDWFDVNEAPEGEVLPDTKSELNPMIGATYVLPDSTRVFASIARKTRFPTLDQLYGSNGNSDLEAERSTNYTLGMSRFFGNLLKVELAPFYHDISNYITTDAPPHVPGEYPYRNYGKIAMYGFEFTGELYPMENLVLRLGYTYNRARNRSADRVTDKVSNIPQYKVDVGAAYVVPNWKTRLDVNMVYIGSSYYQVPGIEEPDIPTIKQDSYTLFQVKITQPFLDRFEAYVSVNNILDKDYQSEYGFPAPGRTAWVGVRVNLP